MQIKYITVYTSGQIFSFIESKYKHSILFIGNKNKENLNISINTTLQNSALRNTSTLLVGM